MFSQVMPHELPHSVKACVGGHNGLGHSSGRAHVVSLGSELSGMRPGGHAQPSKQNPSHTGCKCGGRK